ncbi:CDP-alcohol phosphatidyltransferase family protein [Ferruginibacter lapsinanis]|uniref:CDP-alcohol phosphatidyltransferase family protein n=1 Tax=Ferruginibacter lapsinanis TaxID=563172 RepID=UPI001E2CF97C|nr:CDP-alcohol phosphatidyltransferase family protein [Ferruginibacter lapsinanis]UEG48592.1 CDP-alcohol phosphatidyltransferase family protein [Ferruginibacter lapsinanis]
MTKQIPNIFTLLNLFLGCIAIVFALQTENIIIYTDDQFSSSFNIPEKLSYAALLLFAAAVVDFLDGFVARLLKATSEMGKQLDSLSDVVSFGVAPGVILYQLLRMSFAREENGLEVSMICLLPAFLVSCAAAYRLAKFNIDETQGYSFKGVPTPAVGLLVASFPLILHYGSGLLNVNDWLINKWFLYAAVLLLSWLMVSNLPIMALKFKDYTIKNNMPKLILLGVALIAIILLKWLAVPIIFIAYIILSLALKNKTT